MINANSQFRSCLSFASTESFPSAPTDILRAMKFMASIERDAATERRGYSAFAITISILYSRYRARVRSQYGDAAHE